MQFGIGQSVKRKEDVRLVTGTGCYTDDVALTNAAHVAFVRSPYAHARIRSIDAGAALTAPGVIGVLTQEDVAKEGVGTMPFDAPLKDRYGKPILATPKTLLAGDKARFIGEAVAMVVAESQAQAQDAAELVIVDYEELGPVGSLEDAAAGEGDQIWEQAPGNLAFDWANGDEKACDTAFAQAAHKVSVDVVQNKITAAPIETRAAIGMYEPASGLFTLQTNSQGPYGVRHVVCDALLKIPHDKLRVMTPDVGGGFGLKGEVYVEQVLVLLAAKAFGRPVKWYSERNEAFLADTHARDARTHGEIALDAEGKILALRVSGIANLGGYVSQVGPAVPTAFGMNIIGGMYRLPSAFIQIKGYFSNNAPIAPYRGAGRPEAAYLMDRLLDCAALELGLDRAEIRRRNLLRPDEMPYANFAGVVYDSGDGVRNLDDALARANRDGFAARRADSERRGKKRGLGLIYYMEIAGGPPVPDRSSIRFTDNGAVDVYASAQSTGQGHETTFAQLVAEQLGVPFESVTIRQGDTFYPAAGFGSVGSRSLQTSGVAMGAASEEVIKKGKVAAGQILQAGGSEVSFAVSQGVGRFKVAGSERAISTAELAVTLRREKLPGFENGLDSEARYAPKSTFPNGCHICEVEVDIETGQIDVARYIIVDDLGRIVNPLIVEGQIQGGLAQGLGQVLIENCVYDRQSGQLLTASFMDYGMPRASDVPSIEFAYNEIACATNPLGSKGAGEASTVGSLAALVGAICDALGVAHIDMPITPEKAWRALRNAKAA